MITSPTIGIIADRKGSVTPGSRVHPPLLLSPWRHCPLHLEKRWLFDFALTSEASTIFPRKTDIHFCSFLTS